MLRRRMALVLMMAAVIGTFWLVEAFCQEEAEEQPAGEERAPAKARKARDRGQRGQRGQEARQRAEQQMREQLGVNEEQWTNVFQPRIQKVQQLQAQTRVGFAFGRGGATRGRGRGRGRATEEGQPPAAGAEQPGRGRGRELSDVQRATAALREMLANERSAEVDIKAGLDDLRKAREKAEKELAVARKELLEVCNVRQEAQLVLRGILQ